MKREENLKLFQDREKNWITYGDLVRAMKEVKAEDSESIEDIVELYMTLFVN